MNPFVKYLSAIVLSGAILPAQAAVEILDKVIAVVDDDVVMESELQERLALVKGNIAASDQASPPEDILVRETLDRLILENIQLQMGQRYGVRIDEQQINGAVARLASQNGLTPEQFINQLESSNISYAEFRDNMTREMIIQRVQAGNVNQRIDISDAEIEAFLRTPEGAELIQPAYRLLHARLDVLNTENLDNAKPHVKGLAARIDMGEDFNAVIASSEEPYAFTGGDLGLRRQAELPSLFTDIVVNMREGGYAGPIENGNSFHFIYLLEKRGGTQIIPQTRARHILIKPSEILTSEEARALAKNLKNRILSGEDFEEIAREYSEDIGSAQEGGELGWASPGQMVPVFENAMAQAEINEVTDPFESPYGWHILQVLERRQQDVTELVNRNRAEDFLHNRKYQEELDAWLRQIRDEAFVDIK
jgi:peptidyl-prolyl cis-trans isomerase SurA